MPVSYAPSARAGQHEVVALDARGERMHASSPPRQASNPRPPAPSARYSASRIRGVARMDHVELRAMPLRELAAGFERGCVVAAIARDAADRMAADGHEHRDVRCSWRGRSCSDFRFTGADAAGDDSPRARAACTCSISAAIVPRASPTTSGSRALRDRRAAVEVHRDHVAAILDPLGAAPRPRCRTRCGRSPRPSCGRTDLCRA